MLIGWRHLLRCKLLGGLLCLVAHFRRAVLFPSFFPIAFSFLSYLSFVSLLPSTSLVCSLVHAYVFVFAPVLIAGGIYIFMF